MREIAVPIGQLYLRMISPFSIVCAANLCPTAMWRRIVIGTPSSTTVSPDLSARSATATLSLGERRITTRLVAVPSLPEASSELAISVVRLDRIHAADERAAHLAF